MKQFNVNTTQQGLDLYKNFKFRIKWNGKFVAGVSRVSTLVRKTEAVEYRDCSDPGIVSKSPGQTECEPITLERGVMHDTDFER